MGIYNKSEKKSIFIRMVNFFSSRNSAIINVLLILRYNFKIKRGTKCKYTKSSAFVLLKRRGDDEEVV